MSICKMHIPGAFSRINTVFTCFNHFVDRISFLAVVLSRLSAIFTLGNNFCDFLFASLKDKAFLKWSLFQKEK